MKQILDWIENQEKLAESAEQEAEGPRLVTRISELEDVLRELLSTITLDWYTAQFGQNEAPSGCSTGLPAKIHNIDTQNRILAALQKAREVLKK